MATISVPFTSGVIADQAIQQRHLADGSVGAAQMDPTWPVIMRGVAANGWAYVVGNKRTVFSINLNRVCSRALVTFVGSPVVYLKSQNPCGIGFNFGALTVGLEHTYLSADSALLQMPAILVTKNFREATRMTDGANEYLDDSGLVRAGGQFSRYQDAGLYGWYSFAGQTASFMVTDGTPKGVLESAWLDGTFLRFAFRTNATTGGTQWAINASMNIYAI
jgi:hypothetical protein